jgi:sigma-B regulation protein RsbU (phosphoserine phosphatase)
MQTPVLFISANEELATKVQGFDAGGVDYIPKPFAGEEVIARVGTHLRLRQAYERLAELQAERIQGLAGAQEAVMPLPAELPEAQFQVSLRQVLQAGGDFYDVMPVGHQVVDYVVADASGHDLSTSFWTAALKTLLSEYATPAASPRGVLRSINSALCRILPQGIFFTLIYARLNRQIGKLTLVSAGHPAALLLRSRERRYEIVHQEADVLGAFADAVFSRCDIQVNPGDRFFLFSDGLLDVASSREQGLDRLAEACALHQSAPLTEAVPLVVRDLTTEAAVSDDLLLMGVEV